MIEWWIPGDELTLLWLHAALGNSERKIGEQRQILDRPRVFFRKTRVKFRIHEVIDLNQCFRHCSNQLDKRIQRKIAR